MREKSEKDFVENKKKFRELFSYNEFFFFFFCLKIILKGKMFIQLRIINKDPEINYKLFFSKCCSSTKWPLPSISCQETIKAPLLAFIRLYFWQNYLQMLFWFFSWKWMKWNEFWLKIEVESYTPSNVSPNSRFLKYLFPFL